MNWTEIVTWFGGATAVVAGATYILKHSFERALDSKLKALEERQKAHVTEEFRQRAAVFDRQFDCLRTLLALVYRARNAAHTLISLSGSSATNASERLHSYHAAIQELLFEQRAVLPPEVFVLAHEIKHMIGGFLSAISVGRGQFRTKSHEEDAKACIQRLDEAYDRITTIIQEHLRVEKPA